MGVDFSISTMSEADFSAAVAAAEESGDDVDALYEEHRVYSGPGRSYSGFMRWRRAIAALAGFELLEMYGYRSLGNDFYKGTPWPEWDGSSPSLVPLLHHSDCDGDLSPQECAAVATALQALPPLDGEYDSEFTQEFLEMLKTAANEDLWVVFH